MTTTFRYICLAGLIAALASLPLFVYVPNPYNSILLHHLHNWGHSFLFFGFHLLNLFVVRNLCIRYLQQPHILLTMATASLISFGLGIAIEFVQPFVGRDFSWLDAGRNGLGIIAANGAALALLPETQQRRVKAVGTLVAISALILSLLPAAPWAYAYLLQAQAFPVLNDFENPYINKHVVAASGAEIDIINAPEQWLGNQGKVARIAMPQEKRFPGMQLRNPKLSWLGYSTLTFDAFSPDKMNHLMAVNVYSAEKQRRPLLHHKITLQPGLHTYRVPLPAQDVLQEHHVTDALWHALRSEHTIIVYVDNIRLER